MAFSNKTAFSLLDKLGEAEDVLDVEVELEREEAAAPHRPRLPARDGGRRVAPPPLPPPPLQAAFVEVWVPPELRLYSKMCSYGARCRHPDCTYAHSEEEMQEARLRLAHHVNEGKAKLGLGPRPPPQPRYQPLQQQSPHHYMPQLQRHADAARPAAALGASATGSSSSSGAAAGPPRAPPNFKTKLCIPYLHKNGACWHGDRCHFAHGERELRLHLRDEQAMQRELEAHGLRSMHAPDTPPLPPPPPHAQPHLTQPRQQLAPPPPGFSSFRSTPAAHQPAPALGAKPMSGAALADYLSTAARLEDDAPEWACCPITQELLADPVVAADGHTYERAAIESWLAMRGTSPMTGAQLEDRRLLPNHALVSCMRATLGEHACSARRHTA